LLVIVLNGRNPRGSMRLLRVAPGEDKAVLLQIEDGQLVERTARPDRETDVDAPIELRPFTGQQVYIDGKPVGDPFK
jgi:hypothetical protein